jgi:hypothetical protein
MMYHPKTDISAETLGKQTASVERELDGLPKGRLSLSSMTCPSHDEQRIMYVLTVELRSGSQGLIRSQIPGMQSAC